MLPFSGGERPQLSKESIRSAMKGHKRLDEKVPNMVLDEEIVDPY